MEWQKRIHYRRIQIGFLIIAATLIINFNPLIMGVMGNGGSDKGSIAVFFGSVMDKKLSEEIVGVTGRIANYYNISKVQANSSFIFENKSVAAIWWINELPLPIDLTFLGDFNEWKQMERGLFMLNRYFNETPLQDLQNFGINAYAPVVYPLNGSFVTQKLNIEEDQLSVLNVNTTTLEINASTAWVKLDNQTRMLAQVNKPETEPILGELTSGVWYVDSRTIIGSFSVKIPLNNAQLQFELYEIDQTFPEDVIQLLGQLAQLTLGKLPSESNLQIQFGDVYQLAKLGLVVITGVLSVLILVKFGVVSKVRDIVVGVFLSTFLFIAHIAYSPQRRRINEAELLENELRGQIVDFLALRGEQGAHLREIQREVGCGISSLLWHLQALDDFNLITHEKIGKYHIFYLIGAKSVQISEIALALKSDVAKELCRVLIRKGKPLSLSKISQEIDVHHSSVQHHIKRLGELGIIITLREKKRSKYVIGPKRLSWLKDHLEVA